MRGTYGAVIRQLRDARGWKQDDLAKRAKVSRETVSRAENGGNVGLFQLYRFAHAFRVDITVFFGGGPSVAEVKPPSVWNRLGKEQRADVERYALRLLGARAPGEETE